MLELILIRHGETEANVKNACIGRTDVDLTGRGLRQMQSLARVFHSDDITAVYSSPLKRAVKSAEAINKYHNLPIEKLEGLAERDYGAWENKTYAEIKEENTEEYEEWLKDWLNYSMPMGESIKEAFDRNVEAIKKIIEKNPSGKVIAVTHLGVIRNLLAYFMEAEPAAGWHFKVKNAAICRLEIDEEGYATMLSFNEI